VLTLVLVFVLVLHALFALALWYVMQPGLPQVAVAPVDTDQALVVHLIDAALPPEPPTPLPRLAPPPQAAHPHVRPVTHEKPRSDAMVVQDHEATPAPAASAATSSASSVFAKDGSVRLSPAQTNYASTNPKIKPASPRDDNRIMQHDFNQMHTKTTRFEKYFPPPNESVGGAVSRHIGDTIKAMAKSICDPKKPGFNPLCGSPPIPPSPKDGDERLSMPSAPLTQDPDPPKPPSLSSCIAEYKAIKPLSYGCPIDTPELAFKAEVRICNDLFRAGKRLQPWCPVDTPKRAAAESSPAASSSVGAH
jgi:hypothetical protein